MAVGPRALVPVSTFVKVAAWMMSALSQSTDIAQHERQVRKVPIDDIGHSYILFGGVLDLTAAELS
jgi:hypothetical protein